MATTTIPWSDGSGDNIYLTYSSASGDQTVTVSSDANTGSSRTQTVTFSATGATSVTLTVNQAGAPQQYTVTFNPSSNNASGSVSNPSNAYKSATSTDYAQMGVTKTKNSSSYIYFNFNTSSIPENAVIDSVECKAKACITSSSSTSTLGWIQMFTGTTAKGSSSSLTTSAATYTFSEETWTRSELSNIRVRVYGTRYGGSSTVYLRFYGATLTIKYTI